MLQPFLCVEAQLKQRWRGDLTSPHPAVYSITTGESMRTVHVTQRALVLARAVDFVTSTCSQLRSAKVICFAKCSRAPTGQPAFCLRPCFLFKLNNSQSFVCWCSVGCFSLCFVTVRRKSCESVSSSPSTNPDVTLSDCPVSVTVLSVGGVCRVEHVRARRCARYINRNKLRKPRRVVDSGVSEFCSELRWVLKGWIWPWVSLTASSDQLSLIHDASRGEILDLQSMTAIINMYTAVLPIHQSHVYEHL